MANIAHSFHWPATSRLPAPPAERPRPESPEPSRSRESAAVRILRTDAELTEAIARAQEFERRNAEVMRSRSERHVLALHHSAAAGSDRDGSVEPGPAA
jgi:hypothetical protein